MVGHMVVAGIYYIMLSEYYPNT